MFIVPVAVWLLYRADAPNALIPTVFFFTPIGGGFFFPLLKLTFMAGLLNQISMGVERVDAILTEDEVVDRDTERQPSDATITFDKVGFAYDETAVLKDVSFTARPGTVTALVGPSGGEKQRISIARAILKDAPIILLDEATASLDPENELYIQAAIDRLVQEKTVVVIAHRLNTVVHADKIVVLEDGRIVEQGAHDDLMRAGELYRRMWDEQQKVREWKFVQQEEVI